MFDVSWSELLILGVVTLIFVGPKELPRFLNQLGRYLGVIRRQANEFRSVFEQAMREAEMDEIKKEVRAVSDGLKSSIDEATRSVDGVRTAARVDDAANSRVQPKAVTGAPPPTEAAPSAAGEGNDPAKTATAAQTGTSGGAGNSTRSG